MCNLVGRHTSFRCQPGKLNQPNSTVRILNIIQCTPLHSRHVTFHGIHVCAYINNFHSRAHGHFIHIAFYPMIIGADTFQNDCRRHLKFTEYLPSLISYVLRNITPTKYIFPFTRYAIVTWLLSSYGEDKEKTYSAEWGQTNNMLMYSTYSPPRQPRSTLKRCLLIYATAQH